MVDAIPDMGNGAHATQESEYFNYLNKLFAEAQALEIVNVKKLNYIPAKDIYADFTSSFPKYDQLPWDDIWTRLNHPVLTSPVRDIMFLLIHNCLPTRDRLFRLNMCDSAQCTSQDGIEDTEHLFTACVRTQVAWEWSRRKIFQLMSDWVQQFPSNFEVIHLVYEALLDGGNCVAGFSLLWLCMGAENKSW